MPPHRLLGLILCVPLLALSLPGPAGAADVGGASAGQSCEQSPYHLAAPPRFVAAPPGPHRYAEYNVYCPWYGYGFGVPTYNWGYFGARYRPAVTCHQGYYGDCWQWSYRRGY